MFYSFLSKNYVSVCFNELQSKSWGCIHRVFAHIILGYPVTYFHTIARDLGKMYLQPPRCGKLFSNRTLLTLTSNICVTEVSSTILQLKYFCLCQRVSPANKSLTDTQFQLFYIEDTVFLCLHSKVILQCRQESSYLELVTPRKLADIILVQL